jgi:hypothetical protein
MKKNNSSFVFIVALSLMQMHKKENCPIQGKEDAQDQYLEISNRFRKDLLKFIC